VTTLERQSVAPTEHRTPARTVRTPFRPHVIGAVLRRDFGGYFSNPAGYVFITLFVLVSSWAAFGLPAFFANNLANLDSLNHWMPYLLLFFIPAVTMSVWADERRQGTEELLLTLPARDVEVVLGKYFACVGIYTVALLFSLSHVIVLLCLGRPDAGVLFATYVGYWLMGAMLIAVGMVASILSSNATVGFILGALFGAVPVFAWLFGSPLSSVPGLSWLFGAPSAHGVRRLIESLSVPAQFDDFGNGVITLAGVLYFVSLAALMLYVNVLLLGRRHWAGGPSRRESWGHGIVRVVAVALALISLDVLVARAGARADVSAEGLNTLSRESRDLIKQIPPDRPVFIQAYYSPEVPREFVETKADVLNLLKEIAALGGDRIRLNLIETERYSDAARDAEKRFGITPKRVFTADEAKQASEEIFLGLAFTSGPDEVVVPFVDRGLPVEYELVRSIRVVSRSKRKKVGILNTDAKLLGGFDFRAMNQDNEWQIVTELKKQYEVTTISADDSIATDLDALLVAQPSSLNQRQIDNLTAYVKRGGATLLLVDPLPMFDPTLSPLEPKMPPGGPFGGGPPPEPKGNLTPLIELLGVEWPASQIVWNPYNPLTQLADIPPEFVFLGPGGGAAEPFGKDPVSSGLQNIVMLFPGYLRSRGNLDYIPLLRTSDLGGTVDWSEVVQRGFMGVTLNRNRSYLQSGMAYTLAARVKGRLPGEPAKPEANAEDKTKDAAKKTEARPGAEANVILVADLDMISDQFFELRKRPTENMDFLNFDNVSFILNCVDELAGDDSFIALRKRRPRHRTLLAVEAASQRYIKNSQNDARRAEDEAKKELDDAQKRLDQKVEAVRSNKEMDDRTKTIALENLQAVENRRFEVTKASIEDAKKRKVEESRADKERSIQGIHNRIKVLAILLPPLPALVLAGFVFAVRLGRENQGANPNRLA
jgi:ABC-2 type transport system permease protein